MRTTTGPRLLSCVKTFTSLRLSGLSRSKPQLWHQKPLRKEKIKGIQNSLASLLQRALEWLHLNDECLFSCMMDESRFRVFQWLWTSFVIFFYFIILSLSKQDYLQKLKYLDYLIAITKQDCWLWKILKIIQIVEDKYNLDYC